MNDGGQQMSRNDGRYEMRIPFYLSYRGMHCVINNFPNNLVKRKIMELKSIYN